MGIVGMKGMPRVRAVMTPFPYSIPADAPVERAREMMREHAFRHLPVVEGDEPVGVVSARALRGWARGVAGESGHGQTVGDVSDIETYVIDLSEPLDRVLLHMARHQVGAAVVVKEGRLAGIFTLSDACRCFAEFLREQFPPSGGDDAA